MRACTRKKTGLVRVEVRFLSNKVGDKTYKYLDTNEAVQIYGCGLKVNVREAMTKNPITVNLNASVYDVAKIMRKEKIGSIVVSEKGGLSGIVTERDLVRKVLARKKDPKNIKVSEIMSKPVISTTEDEDILAAAELMKKNKIRRLVVVDKSKKIVGIITTNDMARVMRRAAEELGTTFYLMSRGMA